MCKWLPRRDGCLLGRSFRSIFVTGIAAASSSLVLCISAQNEDEKTVAATMISLRKSNGWAIDHRVINGILVLQAKGYTTILNT